MMLPSRRDLAREFGVSPITIERAISPLLAEGVLRADDRRGTFVARAVAAAHASTLDLSPVNPQQEREMAVARALNPPAYVEGTTATVGIVASLYVFNRDHLELHNFWIRLLVQSMEHGFSENGHRTRFYNRVQGQGHPLLPLREAIESALADGVDALAIIGLGLAPQEVDESLTVLEGRNLPVVCITSGELRRPVSHVFFDNRAAGYDAAHCLLQSGCRELIYFAPFTATWAQERLEGIRDALEYAGMDAGALCTYPNHAKPWEQEEDPQVLGYEFARSFFAEGKAPAGMICANDGLALGFLRAAEEHGLTAGHDFAIVSFDDHPDARHTQLTTLRPPMEAMGQEASKLLLRTLRGEQTLLQMRLRWHLIPRFSCGMPTPSSLP